MLGSVIAGPFEIPPLAVLDEGFELNILGLNLGIDAAVPALKLPAIGRLGLPR